LGLVLKGLGRLDEAEISYKKAIALKPDYTKAYNNLGIIMQELGRLDEAEKSFRQAITLKPDYAEAHSNLGLVLKGLGRLDEAEISYRHAITLKPDYAEAHSNLGLVLKELGRLDEAEASYKKAITLKPDFLEAIINRWLLLFNKKRFEAALLDADLCISKGSRQLDLTTLYALGRIDEIYKRIEVKSKIDSENITIAAFASFIAEVEKKDTAYNFCPNPIDFIHYANLSTHINDSNSYIAEVIHELDGVKTIWQPSKKSTVGGFQTPSGVNLFKSPTGKIEQLKSIIINELDVYHKKYSNKSCSYIKKWPFQNYLNGWYVVLKKQGYQSPHIHPGGWLSGVIYLKVVPSLDKNEGAIEFNLNGEYYSNVNSSKVIYQPKLGDIVFFPSSLHHRTIPFSTNTDRIIVSFDLKPKQF
jgi:Flp pilus assembly protein TadD